MCMAIIYSSSLAINKTAEFYLYLEICAYLYWKDIRTDYILVFLLPDAKYVKGNSNFP
jgi:hypothetical protein